MPIRAGRAGGMLAGGGVRARTRSARVGSCPVYRSEEEKALPGVHRPLPNLETWDGGVGVETESKCGPPPPATVRRPARKEHYFISPAPVLKALISTLPATILQVKTLGSGR